MHRPHRRSSASCRRRLWSTTATRSRHCRHFRGLSLRAPSSPSFIRVLPSPSMESPGYRRSPLPVLSRTSARERDPSPSTLFSRRGRTATRNGSRSCHGDRHHRCWVAVVRATADRIRESFCLKKCKKKKKIRIFI
ncbi:hypothetical protein AAHE18_07G185200 [Arachis hypogaea]